MEFCKTGIQVLDELLGGGIPVGHIVLISGSSGTGKTTLSLEFLFRGAKLYDETGVYISFSESAERMKKNMEKFNFYDPSLLNSKVWLFDLESTPELSEMFSTVHSTPVEPSIPVNLIKKKIQNIGAKRVVIDSITTICQSFENKVKSRMFISSLQESLSILGCTVVLISEIPPMRFVYSQYGVEEFVSDGIILLREYEKPEKPELLRTLQIIKMRGLRHSRIRYAMSISEEGIHLSQII